MVRVMFVCLGNICRSPLAEAVFAQLIKDNGLADKLYVESCGTASYHIGENPDPRTIAVARRHDIPIDHKAQQLSKEHFSTYDYLVLMDESNVENAQKIRPTSASANMLKMRDFDMGNLGADVEDPWFGGDAGFEECYEVVNRCSKGFLHFLVNKHDLT